MKYEELERTEIVALVGILTKYETAFSVTPNDWHGWDIEIEIIDDDLEAEITEQIESITSKF